MKIVFLDIDGVIATPDYVKDGMWALNPDKQALLANIVSNTSAKIVLSSSWRKHSLEDTKYYMKEEGFILSDSIIGITIRGYHYIQKGVHLSIPRGVEIKQWIDTNIHSDNGKNWEKKKVGEDFTYVILDDDTDMLLEQKDYFLKCDSIVGLTDDIVNKAIDILNNLHPAQTPK